jgi:hypothetical protein
LVGQGTPLGDGVSQPFVELHSFVADEDPANVVTDDRQAQQVSKFLLQLLNG